MNIQGKTIVVTRLHDVQRLGQSIWYDNIRRGLIVSGELRQLIQTGITGLTANPTIFEKAIVGSNDYDETLVALSQTGKNTKEIYEGLAEEDIRAAADLLRLVHASTGGADGYASLEVSPALAHDTEGTVAEAKRLFASLGLPNVMIKVPATPEGIPAIKRLIAEGVNVNVTLTFSLDVYRQVMEAYISGLEDLAMKGGDVSKVASVASFFVSRVDSAVDILLEERLRQGETAAKALLGKAGIANAKLAYRLFQSTFAGQRFAALKSKGARVQRPLWASTGTKNPHYSDVLYMESLIGPDTVNTVPPATLMAFLDHGRVAATLEQGVDEAEQVMDAMAKAGISMEQVTAKLLADGVQAFADSFDKLLANIHQKREQLLVGKQIHPGASLGPLRGLAEEAIEHLQKQDVVGRIWRKDHTVWKNNPAEITNRLGWLSITDSMSEHVPALEAFARDVRDAGFRHVVLLGMGGSSLGPEVLRRTFGSSDGYPELIVLDSTVPDWVRSVEEVIDPAQTLFLVSSKSGETIEPLSFYKYFRGLVEQSPGKSHAGRNFVAITDRGTSLERLAEEQGFRRVFLNPSDIGGRYSVLSYFGMVPAALLGIDITSLLDRADCMREGCASCVPAQHNPGAWLGAIMGKLAQTGRDKLTLVTSPLVSSFGLWVEQLIAESTGKEGKGIIPVAGEPLLDPACYGNDRLFVYLRLNGDDNQAVDRGVELLQSAGQPVVVFEMKDRYDLGAEFFHWEFATAVAGAVLGINPFDQPDVQLAKDLTANVMGKYRKSGRLPKVESAGSLRDLLAGARHGDYLAIMAYLHQTPEVDDALMYLRKRAMERHRVATTLGYGPRFLHSTGQLHKGGPNSGLFLQLTAGYQQKDIPVTGDGYTFGLLADAEALGDLQALKARGRRVIRVRLNADKAADIKRLADELA
ncbi:MAG: bifunctional transaldolase/phosoglucose isomerase [Chloroflexi bacterium]|nr:bifunctional transaldolase/phosoglucose isomerase [Chloroflexota bacterium]